MYFFLKWIHEVFFTYCTILYLFLTVFVLAKMAAVLWSTHFFLESFLHIVKNESVNSVQKKRPIVFCNYKNGSTREFPLEFWCFSWFIYKFSSQCYTAHACSLLRTFFNKITKVNWGLEGTSDIMVTTKFGVGSILSVQFIIRISPVLGAGRPQSIAVDPLRGQARSV